MSSYRTAEKHFEKRDIQTWLKHALLTEYIKNWGNAIGLATNSKYIPEIHFVDGFAGRGYFEDGNKGSPLIAIENLQDMQYTFEQNYKKFNSSFVIHLVELKKDYIDFIKVNIKNYSKYPELIYLYHGKFEDKLSLLLNQTVGHPALYFIDPFGYKGVRMNDVVKIISHQSHEVLINVMTISLVRNITIEENSKELCNFFGLDDIDQNIVDYMNMVIEAKMNESKPLHTKLLKLEDKILELYIEQVKKRIPDKKLYFLKKRIYSGLNPKVYFHLLFITGHRRGLVEMKKAMVNFDLIRDKIENQYIHENKVQEHSILGDIFSEQNEYEMYNYETFVNDFKKQFNFKKTTYAEIVEYFLEYSPLPFKAVEGNKSIYDYFKRLFKEVRYIDCSNKSFSSLKEAETNIIYPRITMVQQSLF